ncbi:MAG: hypothetical protein E6F99_22665 [Actinobacteria bacterium]|nr:MAG: hypothetical protein E6F99_22665 [Actinomycetota bacterium]
MWCTARAEPDVHALLFSQSFAVAHPSEPNYLALFSGSTQGVTDDSCPHTFGAANLGQELIGAGLAFAGYCESMPSNGYTGQTVTLSPASVSARRLPASSRGRARTACPGRPTGTPSPGRSAAPPVPAGASRITTSLARTGDPAQGRRTHRPGSSVPCPDPVPARQSW